MVPHLSLCAAEAACSSGPVGTPAPVLLGHSSPPQLKDAKSLGDVSWAWIEYVQNNQQYEDDNEQQTTATYGNIQQQWKHLPTLSNLNHGNRWADKECSVYPPNWLLFLLYNSFGTKLKTPSLTRPCTSIHLETETEIE